MSGECSDPVGRARGRLRAMFDRHDHRCVDCGIVFFCGCEVWADETDDLCPTCGAVNELIDADAAALAAAMADTP